MTSPFPELRTIALIESAEAIVTNLDSAITYEIGSVVGFQDIPPSAYVLDETCDIDIGDSGISNAIDKVLNSLCDGFRAITSRLFEIATNFAFAIEAFMSNLLEGIISSMEHIVSTVTTVLGNAVMSVVEQMRVAVDAIVNALSSVVTQIAEQVRSIVESLQDIVSAIFNAIQAVVVRIVNTLGDAVAAVVETVGQVLVALRDGIASILGSIVDAVWAVIVKIGNGIASLIDTVIGTAETGLGKVREVIESIPSTLRELATDAQKFIGDSVGSPLANIGDIFINQVEAFFGRMIEDLEVSPEKIIREFLTGVGLRSDEVERIATAADRAMPRTPAIFVIVAGFLAVTLLPPIVTTILQPALQEIQQEVAQRVTPTLIPAGDAMEAFFRGHIDETKLQKEMGEAGYSKDRIDTMLLAGQRLMGVGDLVTWWLREFITDNEFDNLLAMQRITPTDIENIKQAVFFIPPVQDLIRMAVREVFTPDIRERFKLDEGFPTEFQEAAKWQGVSEEWAKNYWAAHWVLPSVTQGFAMLHRKVISDEELDLLLRAQDVMPFWRERVTQVAYNPLTRVDLRRMHRLGLLTLEELQLRYEDLGFAPENAALMVQFTEAFNEEEPPDVELELEGLTRGTILGMFDDGVLTEGESTTALIALGVSEAATALFITQRKLETERRTRTSLIENVVQLVGGGHVNLDAGLDNLASMGLTATEIAIATQRILNKRKGRDRLPTPVQLDKMLLANIVDAEQWNSAMAGLGFSDDWIARIAELGPMSQTSET